MAVRDDQKDLLEKLKKKKKGNKYLAKKFRLAGMTFDSKAEAARWVELRIDKDVHNLRRQFMFGFDCGVKYFADFLYIRGKLTGDCCVVVEDCKGMETAAFRIKRKLLKKEKNIDVQVVKMPPKKVERLLQIGLAKWGE